MELLSRCNSIRHTHLTEEIKAAVLSKETEVVEAIGSINNGMIEVTERLQEASSKGVDGEADDEFMMLQEINEERATLEASLKALEGLLLKTQEQRTGISITNVRISEGGRAAAGLINTRGKYADVNLTIDNVEATKDGKVVVGIVEGLDLGGIL
jgi:protein subunit release factor A